MFLKGRYSTGSYKATEYFMALDHLLQAYKNSTPNSKIIKIKNKCKKQWREIEKEYTEEQLNQNDLEYEDELQRDIALEVDEILGKLLENKERR